MLNSGWNLGELKSRKTKSIFFKHFCFLTLISHRTSVSWIVFTARYEDMRRKVEEYKKYESYLMDVIDLLPPGMVAHPAPTVMLIHFSTSNT